MHPRTRPALSLLLLLAAALPSLGTAQSCGDTVSGHVVLTADLHCTSGWTALYVDTPGTTIDLNGHTLSGDVALEGIALLEAHGTVIKGPGTIRGFWAGVNSSRSEDVRVEGVQFEQVDVGVIVTNADHSVVARNRFTGLRGHAVTISQYPGASGGGAGGHAILDNHVQEAVFGFQLCGAGTGRSLIRGNTLEKVRDYGIHVENGSESNRIESNTFGEGGETGIRIAGSSYNVVEGNTMKRGRIGIALYPDLTGACVFGGAAAEVRDTLVRGNGVFELETAIVVGLGPTTAPRALKNRINGNKLYYGDRGILFLDDSYANDATGNAYYGTTTPVTDYGIANFW